MLWESNIIIYASIPGQDSLRQMARSRPPVVSAISRVEVLGNQRLNENARSDFQTFFSSARILPVTDDVINEAMRLRQMKRLKLGDSIIAATALLFGHTLITHNLSDFKGIEGLDVFDPLVGS